MGDAGAREVQRMEFVDGSVSRFDDRAAKWISKNLRRYTRAIWTTTIYFYG